MGVDINQHFRKYEGCQIDKSLRMLIKLVLPRLLFIITLCFIDKDKGYFPQINIGLIWSAVLSQDCPNKKHMPCSETFTYMSCKCWTDKTSFLCDGERLVKAIRMLLGWKKSTEKNA